jgi:hypothetical protein
MTVVTLVKGEQRQEITRGFHYESSEGLEFIQFSPPIKKGRAEVEYLYLQVFDMETKSSLTVLPQSFKLTIPKSFTTLEIRLIKPSKYNLFAINYELFFFSFRANTDPQYLEY